MNFNSIGTPLHRAHSNILCNCYHCKQFDYAETAPLPQLRRPAQKKNTAGYQVISLIDTETGNRSYGRVSIHAGQYR